MLAELVIILCLVLANGVLAGAEIAVVALRRTRLTELVDAGSRPARAVQALRDRPERFLATVQIGITVVAATAGAFGGATLARDLAPLLERVPAIEAWASELALAIIVLLVSYLSLVIGELVPKSLALRASERYSMLIGRPLLWLSTITAPFVWLLTASSNLVLRLFGDRTSFVETRLSPEELQQLVEEASKAGTLNPLAGEIASRAIDFPALTVEEVMVPRREVVAIPRRAPRAEVRRVLLEEGHSRVPVYEGSIDNVVGYISLKDVLAIAWEEDLFVIEDLLRPPYFVPPTLRAIELLKQMQRRRAPFAIVIEESGGLAGIVTIEDLLEELVGEIFSEHVARVPELITPQPDGTVLVAGTAAVREINRALQLELPEEGDWSTIAGLCLAIGARIPAEGERLVTANGYGLEIVDASPRRVRVVRIHPPPAPLPAPAPSA